MITLITEEKGQPRPSSSKYLLKIIFLYTFLKWIKFGLCWASLLSPFHRLTPQTEMHIFFNVEPAKCTFKLSSLLRLYPPSLSLNIFWILPGKSLLLAVNIINAVLYSTRSMSFMTWDCKNSMLVWSRYPALLTIRIAFFWRIHNGFRLSL